MKYILALDKGATSSRAILFDILDSTRSKITLLAAILGHNKRWIYNQTEACKELARGYLLNP